MTMTRRSFFAATAGLTILPRRLVAETALGDTTLTTVSDGSLTLPGDLIFGPMPQDSLAGILDAYGQPRDVLTPECNLALLQDGQTRILFDVGSGPDFMPTAGSVVESLDAAALSPEEITHVVFTHAHPDHIWGLLDDFDDLVFPDATYMMGRTEWDYWWNPGTIDSIGADRQAFAVGARRRMERIEDRIVLFDDGEEILPGIAAVATHGHTPGHMSFEIEKGGERAFVIGDAIGNHHVAFARPDWPSGSDQNQDEAAITRTALLERLATAKATVVGFHLPDGGVGRVDRDGDGYRFLPERI